MTRPWHRAAVVFSDHTEMWWLRALKPGFRHCFVALAGERGWVVIDPLAHYTEVAPLDVPAECDLAAWYRSAGLIAIDTIPRLPPRTLAPVRLHSCVETVKRVLGLHAPLVMTPWQLYRYLLEQENNR